MYETFFRLQKRPFAATPDPACMFPAPALVEGLAQLDRSVEAGQGIGLVVAPSGLGKTLLLRALAKELLPKFTVVSLSAAGIASRRALLQGILYELGERYSGLDEDECRLELRTSLRRMLRSGRSAVLLIDEADQLDTTQLAELRTWVEVADDGEPYLRLVLAGLPALEDRLVQPELSAFNERISTLVYLRTLGSDESRAYVEHRLAWAGLAASRGAGLFTDDALDLVIKICDGLPRCLNQLCDHALLLAYVAEAPIVERKQVEEALGDLKQLPLHWNPGISAETGPQESGEIPVVAPVPAAAGRAEDEWTAEPRSSGVVWSEDGAAASSAFDPHAESASFEVGADPIVEFGTTPVDTVRSWESSEGIGDFRAEAEAPAPPVEFRTSVTPADLAPACDIDSEMESRLRDLLLARSTEPAPASDEADLSPAADSRGVPPGEDWVLPPQALDESDDPSDEEYETEVVRDPWSPGAVGDRDGLSAATGSERDVVAEVSASRQSGYVTGESVGFAGAEAGAGLDGSSPEFSTTGDSPEIGRPLDVLPFLAAHAESGATNPPGDEDTFTRRPQPDFAIEPVPDRYAALDDGKVDLPPVEPTTGRDLKSLVEPVLTSLRRERDPRPDRAVDEILALVEEARRLDAPATRETPRHPGETVVDGWGVVETGTFDDADTSAIEDETVLEGYDAVEPDTSAEFPPTVPSRGGLRDLADLHAAPEPEPVRRRDPARAADPEPTHTDETSEWRDATPSRYKRLFSLLRRKHRRAS